MYVCNCLVQHKILVNVRETVICMYVCNCLVQHKILVNTVQVCMYVTIWFNIEFSPASEKLEFLKI